MAAPPSEPVVLLAQDHAGDPYRLYQLLHRAGGVHRVVTPEGAPAWIVTRYDDVNAALADPRLSLSKQHSREGYSGFSLPPALDANLLNLDPPDHTRLRRLVSAAFTGRRVEDLRPRVQAVTDDLLDAAVRRGHADLVADFAAPLPITVIGDLLGVPVDVRADFRAWTDALLSPDPADPGAAKSAITHMLALLTSLVAAKRAAPADDLLSAMVAVRDEDGDHLGEEELISLAFLILWAGYENSVNLIANTTLTLLRHPDQAAIVRAQPAPDAPGMAAAVEEFLRYDEPAQFAIRRFATEDVRIGEATILAGDTVLLCLAAANRDPARFSHPDAVDATRDRTAPTGPGHLSLGHGIHYCLGAPLARMEAATALWTVFHRCPRLALAVPDEDVQWRPGFRRRALVRLPVTFGSPQAGTTTGPAAG